MKVFVLVFLGGLFSIGSLLAGDTNIENIEPDNLIHYCEPRHSSTQGNVTGNIIWKGMVAGDSSQMEKTNNEAFLSEGFIDGIYRIDISGKVCHRVCDEDGETYEYKIISGPVITCKGGIKDFGDNVTSSIRVEPMVFFDIILGCKESYWDPFKNKVVEEAKYFKAKKHHLCKGFEF